MNYVENSFIEIMELYIHKDRSIKFIIYKKNKFFQVISFPDKSVYKRTHIYQINSDRITVFGDNRHYKSVWVDLKARIVVLVD